MVSLEIKSSGPTIGAPNLWYCDGEGVKQAEAYGTVQCLKNSAVAIVGSPAILTGMNSIESFNSAGEIGASKLYQIVDNGSITLF